MKVIFMVNEKVDNLKMRQFQIFTFKSLTILTAAKTIDCCTRAPGIEVESPQAA